MNAGKFKNKLLINNLDAWTLYGVFLCEEKRGGMDNLTALMTPSEVKSNTAVDYREEAGEKYADDLAMVRSARDVELTFAMVADTRDDWFTQYTDFINYQLKNGWVSMVFPDSPVPTMRLIYKKCSKFTPLTNLWLDGRSVYAARFKVTFREPQPSI